MSETTGEIQAHIRDTRESLDANLNELGEKVKSVTDWRQHYQKSPGLFLAAALGGGLLLALATSGRRSRIVVTSAPALAPAQELPRAPRQSGQLGDSIGAIKGALIGLASTHAKNMLSNLLPGFEAELPASEKPTQKPQEDVTRRPQNGNGTSTKADAANA